MIKRITKKSAGAHGGSWKVAFADFMTAMMCFFLVMWLLGSDEEIRQSVANYFNHPSSAMRPDLSSDKQVPLGDKTGAGEDVIDGADGETPEDLIERPSREMNQDESNVQKKDDVADLADKIPTLDLNIEIMKFTIPEHVLFEYASDRISPKSHPQLAKIGAILKSFTGTMTIQTLSSNDDSGSATQSYEFHVSRVVALMNFVVKQRWIDENRVIPQVVQGGRSIASNKTSYSTSNERHIEFILKR